MAAGQEGRPKRSQAQPGKAKSGVLLLTTIITTIVITIVTNMFTTIITSSGLVNPSQPATSRSARQPRGLFLS